MIENKKNETLQSFFERKELESMVFVKEGFLHKKIQKEDVFVDLIKNSPMRMEDVVWNSMKPCEGYKVIENVDKIMS